MWCGSSSPLTEMLWASLSVFLGSGQISEDRKLSAEFSLEKKIRRGIVLHHHKTVYEMPHGCKAHQLMEASTAPSHSKKLCGSHDCWSGLMIGQESCFIGRLQTSGLCSVQTQRLRRVCNEPLPPKRRRITVRPVRLETLAVQSITTCQWLSNTPGWCASRKSVFS